MITYTHKTHPRSRSIKIRIGPNGEIVVVTPQFVSKRKIDKFVIQSEFWINQQLTKLTHMQSFGETKNQLMVFGEKYQKEIIFNSNSKIGIKIHQHKAIINPIENSVEKITSEVTRFLKSTAERYIIPRTNQLAKKMSLEFNHITLRQQKTRWGSCSSQKNLNFNWRLVHCSPNIIDYVIIHELSHLKYMNHSKKFWEMVEIYDSEYPKHRGWLKRHGLTLG
ncbi:M48 family metallopeptidase [Patescibacteria group bacterium]|nr:M48 family metallopeptidase [Patescibacteria group bacterium]MBU1967180.1 M48 family metallopeptidase [Patescibacteria group bacterium]MBU2543310.1 M48 family metallopeptidase [Patescibacteria group bacterium]